MEGVREAHFWTDAGPHFRAYQMLWWWCVCVPETWKINTIFSFFTEHHGKGILDRFRGMVPWTTGGRFRGTVPWTTGGQFRVRFRKAACGPIPWTNSVARFRGPPGTNSGCDSG